MTENHKWPDRRSETRHKSLKRAEVVFNNRNSVVSGLVRNLSSTGAKFIVDAPVDLPNDVSLLLSTGEEYQAEIKWQKGKTEFGLKFRQRS